MKNIFMSLPHSATGIRRHLRILLREKWLLVSRDQQDRRVRNLGLTEKGVRAMLQYAEHSSLVIDCSSAA